MEAPSFTSRRPPATNLPNFTLPPPPPDIPHFASDGLPPSKPSGATQETASREPATGTTANHSLYYNTGMTKSGPAPSSSDPNPYGPASALSTGSAYHLPPFTKWPSFAKSSSPLASSSGSYRNRGLEQSHRPVAPTVTYYPESSSPQQPSFPSFDGPSSATSSPSSSLATPSLSSSLTTPSLSSSLTTPSLSSSLTTPENANAFSKDVPGLLPRSMAPPYLGYPPKPPMPPMHGYAPYGQVPGPVLSNVHQPGTPLSMLGGDKPPEPSYGHHLPYYLHGGHVDRQQTERPFKCETCPQSFYRNHDLKRHKRIHLAVKPFPCLNCEKSFSRKDALKVRAQSGFPSSLDADLLSRGTNL